METLLCSGHAGVIEIMGYINVNDISRHSDQEINKNHNPNHSITYNKLRNRPIAELTSSIRIAS